MRKAILAITALVTLTLGMFVVSAPPAWATTDDTAVTITATPQSVNLPTLITYTVKATVQPGSASMGGTVRITFPNTALGMIGANDPSCVQTGLRQVDCTYTSIAVGQAQTWYLQSNTALLGTLNIAVTAAQIDSAPIDVNSSNDSQTRTCTVVLSVITGC